MASNNYSVLGNWNIGRATAAGGTAFAALIPPFYQSLGSTPYLYTSSKLPGNLTGVTKIKSLWYTNGATVHNVGIMRPLNWTTFSAAVAANATAISLTADPGVYSTNYRYTLAATKPAAVADNTIAAGDYCAYQLLDGTWQINTIASGTFGGSNLVLTTAVPNVSGGGINSGAPFFFFGVIGDSDPWLGLAHPQYAVPASVNRQQIADLSDDPFFTAFHSGDPLIFYSPNTTNAGSLEGASGFYTDR